MPIRQLLLLTPKPLQEEVLTPPALQAFFQHQLGSLYPIFKQLNEAIELCVHNKDLVPGIRTRIKFFRAHQGLVGPYQLDIFTVWNYGYEIVLQEDFLQQLEWKDGKIYDALNKLFDISYQPYKDNSVLKDLLLYVKMGGSLETWPLGPGSNSPLLDESGRSLPWYDNGRGLELLGGREMLVYPFLALVDRTQPNVQMVVVDPTKPGTKYGCTCGLCVDEQLRVITCPVKVTGLPDGTDGDCTDLYMCEAEGEGDSEGEEDNEGDKPKRKAAPKKKKKKAEGDKPKKNAAHKNKAATPKKKAAALKVKKTSTKKAASKRAPAKKKATLKKKTAAAEKKA